MSRRDVTMCVECKQNYFPDGFSRTQRSHGEARRCRNCVAHSRSRLSRQEHLLRHQENLKEIERKRRQEEEERQKQQEEARKRLEEAERRKRQEEAAQASLRLLQERASYGSAKARKIDSGNPFVACTKCGEWTDNRFIVDETAKICDDCSDRLPCFMLCNGALHHVDDFPADEVVYHDRRCRSCLTSTGVLSLDGLPSFGAMLAAYPHRTGHASDLNLAVNYSLRRMDGMSATKRRATAAQVAVAAATAAALAASTALCITCKQRVRNVTYPGCRHLLVCHLCQRKLVGCPSCKTTSQCTLLLTQ